MADVGDILNDKEFLGDVDDTLKWGIEQYKKREELKGVMDKGKVHLLGLKWTMKGWTREAMKLLTKRKSKASSTNWMKKVKKLRRR